MLGDNKVLNLHDRYKNFAWRNHGRVSGARGTESLCEGRARATTAREAGPGWWGQHPWGAWQRMGGRGSSPLPKRSHIHFPVPVITPNVFRCPSSKGVTVTPQRSLTAAGQEENHHRELQTHARTWTAGQRRAQCSGSSRATRR